MAAYTTIDNPELYFQVKTYTGTGSDNALTLDGDENMQPDLVVLTRTNSAGGVFWIDSIRGVTKRIASNETAGEETTAEGLKAFGTDGFTVGSESGYNASNDTHVAWCWKAGTAWSNDASATSVGSLDSSGTKNATAGFSIISFTGTESGTPSVAHSLSSTPEFIVSRPLEITDNWMAWHDDLDSQDYLLLNTYASKASASSVWNSVPSSTVINMWDNDGVKDDRDMIMYAWHSVQGFSKCGSYTGNGNADGPFVYLGFRPAFVLFKRTTGSVADWQIWDNKRDPENPVDGAAHWNQSYVPSTDLDINFLSNGFKVLSNQGHLNTDGVEFIYYAVAEQPLVNSKGVPSNAR